MEGKEHRSQEEPVAEASSTSTHLEKLDVIEHNESTEEANSSNINDIR